MRARTLEMRVLAAALLLAAGAAHAAGEFPYYPEYADVFGRYEEVTPAMAVAVVDAGPEAVVAEPLLLRDVNGMPFCYMIEAFPAEDRELVTRWNDVIAKLNAGARLPAAELAAELEALYAVEYAPSQTGSVLPTFTFDYPGAPFVTEGGLPFPAFFEYGRAFRAASDRFDGDEAFYFSRIIATGPFEHHQIFEFENDAGEKVALMSDRQLRIRLADVEEHAAAMREKVREKYELLKKDDAWAEKNHARWREIAEGLEQQGLLSP